jgi:hypothetical protein
MDQSKNTDKPSVAVKRYVVACGPKLNPTDEAMTFANRQDDAEMRKLLVEFFSSLRGVDGRLTKINFHTRQFPAMKAILDHQANLELAHHNDKIKKATAKKDKDVLDSLHSSPPDGPAHDIGIYNRLDESFALPLLVISSKGSGNTAILNSHFINAMMVMIDHKQKFEAEVEEYDGWTSLFPKNKWDEIFGLKERKIIKNNYRDEVEAALAKAKREFVVHYVRTKHVFGDNAYNYVGVVFEKSVADIINYWAHQAGYQNKGIGKNYLWNEKPVSISKNFKIDWSTQRALEETADLNGKYQTQIIDDLVSNHIGDYMVSEIKRLRQTGVPIEKLKGDFHLWRSSLDKLLTNIPESVDGHNKAEGDITASDEKIEEALGTINDNIKNIYQWVSVLSGKIPDIKEQPEQKEAPSPTPYGASPKSDSVFNNHYITQPETNPAKLLSTLTDATVINPFNSQVIETGDKGLDGCFHDCSKPTYYNIHQLMGDSVSFQQIVGFEIKLPDPGISFERLVDIWNAGFEDFLGGKLEERGAIRLTLGLLSGINGHSISLHEFTNSLHTDSIILPDLRTLQPEINTTYSNYNDDEEEYSPSEDDMDVDEAARQL